MRFIIVYVIYILCITSGIVCAQNNANGTIGEFSMIYNDSIIFKDDTIISHINTYQDYDLIDSLESYDLFQNLSQRSDTTGHIQLEASPLLDSLLYVHNYKNKSKKSYLGYRIQIHSQNAYGSDIKQLEGIRDEFEKQYQIIPAYLKYINPDFKIRVGNYHSRLECLPDLKKIKQKYPSSYPVKEYINFEELERVPMQEVLELEKLRRDSITADSLLRLVNHSF